MVNKKLIDALKQIARDLSTHKIKWVLVGSLSLALQGVRIDPKDIDILTDKEGALKLNKIWEKYKIKNVEFGETDRFRSYFGKFRIKDIEVEVMGDLEEKLEGKWFSLAKRLESPKFIDVNGVKVPVSSLEDQLWFYERSDRPKDIQRAQKIREAMKRKLSSKIESKN